MSFLLKKKTQKTKVKDVGAGLGEGGLVSLSGITRILLQELTPRLDLHWTDLEYLKKIKNNYDIALGADLSRFHINMIFFSR